MDHVILVNEQDKETGVMEKMEAHEKALLHRAFSVFIFNEKGHMLLQQRAEKKYHSPGLWTNACCSHPKPGEKTADAARRRLKEELGFTAHIEEIFSFVYKANFSNGLTEYEYDHVFAGTFEEDIAPDSNEVQDYKYQSMQEIETDLSQMPELFTAWFKIAFPQVKKWWQQKYS